MTDPREDEQDIRRVLELYCRCLDDMRIPELLALFDENCTFEMMGRTFHGRAEMARLWVNAEPTDRPSVMHALNTPVIVLEGDRATAVSNWIMIDRSGEGASFTVAMAGLYRDELMRDDAGQWRFLSRRAQALGRPRPPLAQPDA